MSQIAIRSGAVPFTVEMGPRLTLSDDELFELCQRNPQLRLERTAEGDLIIMTPAGGKTSHRNARIVRLLDAWAEEDGTGLVFDSSGGFLLPDGAMRSPDAAWVLRSRLDELPSKVKEGFLPLCPDFVVELRSPSDSLPELQAKMEEYRDHGARLGWLIDPDARRVHVYRPSRPAETLDDPTTLSADPELPGFSLELSPIWQPF